MDALGRRESPRFIPGNLANCPRAVRQGNGGGVLADVEVFKRSIAGSFFGRGCDKNVVPAALRSLS